MLQCLELIGFKSFADRTRIEFGAGLTAIVGPNGSGKSNIVDSIRWILGEQSAKSLRGKEMTDVIFNGSQARRPLGMAEVTLRFDNRQRRLPIEHDEVAISRRVYRSGEGEYLINGQICRLKDIKELFLGTGAGLGAYSIIEQGKVEAMLQASTKDRRFIFEEAAGTSRFRAKTIEALRRLERVEANLARIKDIHDEVEKQLHSLRIQAGKARRFKEMDDRLRHLRVAFGQAEHQRTLIQQRELEAMIAGASAAAKALEVRRDESQTRLQQLEEQLRHDEAEQERRMQRRAELQNRLLAVAGQLQADHQRGEELRAEQLDVQQRRFIALRRRQDLDRTCRSLKDAIDAEEADWRRLVDSKETLTAATAAVLQFVQQHRTELTAANEHRQQLITQLSRLENEQSALDSQLSLLWQQHERIGQRLATAKQQVCQRRLQLVDWQRLGLAIKKDRRRFLVHAGGLQETHQSLLTQRADRHKQLATLRDEQTAVNSRRDVLESIQRRHEGLEGGVRQALTKKASGEPAWQAVIGVLAETLQTPADLADLTELALGKFAQALILPTRADLTDELLASARQLPGRVQFIFLDALPNDQMIVDDENLPWPALPSLIECEERLQPLIESLLGTTYLVDHLDDVPRREGQYRFITRTGELIDPPGQVAVGPIKANTGILSRAAELRELRQQAERRQRRIDEEQAVIADLDEQIRRHESHLSQHELRASTLLEQERHFDDRSRMMQLQLQTAEGEVRRLDEEHRRGRQESAEVRQQSVSIEARINQIHDTLATSAASVEQLTASLVGHETDRQTKQDLLQHVALELGVLEERRTSRSQQLLQAEREGRQRQAELDELTERLSTLEYKVAELDGRRLEQASTLADHFARVDELDAAPAGSLKQLEARRSERNAAVGVMQQEREQLDVHRATAHQAELSLTELRLRRDAARQRLLEDYQLDLEQLPDELAMLALPADLSEADAQREMQELKDKLHRLGGVNHEAVMELQTLEGRAGTLLHQFNDLTSARRQLDEIIATSNRESRRLFLDTFETVKGHFQQIYRKLFGGGKADIVLENEDDVLESGIEIIARPPGKEPRSLSLLSGGEKTLTATALLLALFRSKPSPFCILDEVDAALDESNIGRFVSVLREYLDQSQFILITHSKTTMAAADLLHGVTQRESGVSLRVTVRLEDVGADGAIELPAESA